MGEDDGGGGGCGWRAVGGVGEGVGRIWVVKSVGEGVAARVTVRWYGIDGIDMCKEMGYLKMSLRLCLLVCRSAKGAPTLDSPKSRAASPHPESLGLSQQIAFT